MEEPCILFNSAALNALKRSQLVSLSKSYGLKASGKNTEIIARLEGYAAGMSPNRTLVLPVLCSTPGPCSTMSTTNHLHDDIGCTPLTGLPDEFARPQMGDTTMGRVSRGSDAWEVLSESGASLISPVKRLGLENLGSVSSWKSAGNGESVSEFGIGTSHSGSFRSKSSSIRAIASSIKRTASRTLLSRSTSASSNLMLDKIAQLEDKPENFQEMEDQIPPSPASTVGVPRRHSTISLLERPSTIRLYSPTPTLQMEQPTTEDDRDDLPFFGTAANVHNLQQRRSMAPIRSHHGSSTMYLSRKSMPALPNTISASISKIYPPLPLMASPLPPVPALPSVPGAFPAHFTSPIKAPVVFGTSASGVSNQDFSDVASKMLADMNAKLPQGTKKFGDELLLGNKAAVNRLVDYDSGLGERGWGLATSAGPSKKDRFADIHGKQFAKMHSISSKASTSHLTGMSKQSSLTASTDVTPHKRKHGSATSSLDERGLPAGRADGPATRGVKRSKMITGAHRVVADDQSRVKTPFKSPLKILVAKHRRRSSTLRSRAFGFFGKKKVAPHTSDSVSIAESTSTAASSFVLTEPTLLRKPSVHLGSVNSQICSNLGIQDSSHRSVGTGRRRSTDLSNVIRRRMPNVSELTATTELSKFANGEQDIKIHHAPMSTQSSLSTSSKTRHRSKLPDFGPSFGALTASTASTNSLGLPKSSSINSALSMRKQSQGDIIRSARQVPAPPPEPIPKPESATLKRSTTLHQPTASSLARMQATVRPLAGQPLACVARTSMGPPQTPRFATSMPFGAGSSRENLFDSNFHLPPLQKPAPSPMRVLANLKATPRAAASPTKSAGMRARAKSSGLSAMKSKGNLKGEMDVQKRRAEIKAKQERMTEERELRVMLGGGSGDVHMG